MQDCLENLINRYDDTVRERTRAIVENTKINTELLDWLKAKNGH